MNSRSTSNKLLYNYLALPVAVGAGYVASLFHSKLGEARVGRKDFRKRFSEASRRLEGRPVWFHVASVGEFEQAKPAITELKKLYPGLCVTVTFSSPSGYHFAKKKEVLDEDNNIKFIDYLPADFRRNVRFCLDRLNPKLLVLVKFDLWPNLIWETRERGIPVVLIDATLSPSSPRLPSIGRAFYRTVYDSIDKILAISESASERFRSCVPSHPLISVVGDTRFDRVMERKRLSSPVGFEFLGNGPKIVVGGSTWPRDEVHLLPALAGLLSKDPNLLTILAPHEPHEERIAELTRWAQSAGLTYIVASSFTGGQPPQVILIDTVGILAEAYRFGDVAYVGGSFSTGVHSVIEPAIEELPVLFGPAHDNSFEALRLLETGAGYLVRNQSEIRDRLEHLLYDDDARGQAGDQARRYVESQLGATDKCVAAIAEYL
jgi:3-deoxy-D-manno-octulosonic-acid transferase